MTFTPTFQLHIDFDEDGVFESGEEVSDDLLRWSIQRGKEISQHSAAAAQFDFTLDSLDHKYSPTNTSSPLYPFTLPGPKLRFAMAWPYDSFTASNGTALNGRTIDNGTELGTWTADTGMEINTNEARITGTGQKIATLDYGTPNVMLGAKITLPQRTTTYKVPIFAFRYQDSNDFSYIYTDGVTFDLAEVVAGVDTDLGTMITPGGQLISNLIAGDVDIEAQLKVTGSRAELWLDIPSVASTPFVAAINGLSSSLTATEHGIGGAGFTTDAINSGVTWDDYGMITQFLGRVDAVEPAVRDGNVTAVFRAYDDMERLGLHVLFTGTTDLIPASSGDIAARILSRADFSDGTIIDDGVDPITPSQVDTGNNVNGVPVDTGTVMGGNALTEMYQIQDDEVGLFWIDRWGVARFESSTHRESNDHTADIALWSDTSGGANPYIREPIEWDAGIERVENTVFFKYFRFAKTLSTTVWFLEPDDDPQFVDTREHPNNAGYFIVDIAAIGEELAIANPAVPVPVTDYTVDENADGTGVDWLTPIASESGTVSATGSPDYELDDTGRNWTSDSNTIDGISFGVQNHLIVLQDASGNTAVGTIDASPDIDGDGTRCTISSWPEDAQNTVGYISSDPDFDETDTPLTYDVYVVAAYVLDGFEGNFQIVRFLGDALMDNGTSGTLPFVTSAKIQADKLAASVPAAARAEDSTSQNTHGRRQVSHDTKHIRDWDTAMGRAEKRVALRKDALERVVCHMRNSSAENMLEMLFRDVSDRVNVVYDAMDLDRDYHIENYRLSFQNGLMEIRWELTKVVS